MNIEMKMKHSVLLFLFFQILSLPSSLRASEGPPIMDERWTKLNQMIDAEIATIRGVRNPGANLLHRILELKTQKIELLQERENKIYLYEVVELGNPRNRKREDFFVNSRALYQRALSLGLDIAKNYPQYRDISTVYYTLGMNERNYANNRRIEEFLKLALVNRRDERIHHRSMVELAEFYFNEKRWREAIALYRQIINNRSDEWLAKHYFNFAWSIFQVNERDRAIQLLLESYQLGLKPEYVSLEEQVTNSLALFTIQAGREDDGIRFFTALDPSKNTEALLYMTQLAESQGTYEQTIKVLQQTINLSIRQNQMNQLIRAHVRGLDIYRNSKDYDHFKQTAEHLLKLYQDQKFTEELDPYRQEATEKISGLVGYFQEKIYRMAKTNPQQFRQRNAALLSSTLSYFDLLADFSPENKEDFYFYKGETYFSVALYAESLHMYRLSLDTALHHQRENDFLEQVMNSLLATLGEVEDKAPGIERNNAFTFTRYAYQRHIQLWPESERSRLIFPNFFNLELELKNYDRAESLLRHYQRLFPTDESRQQELAVILMDHYLAEQITQRLNQWVNIINQGFLNFDREYINKSIEALGNLLFRDLREKESSSEFNKIIAGHREIFENEIYPVEIRSEAAFHIARIYANNAKANESFIWLRHFQEIVPPREFALFSEAVVAIIVLIGQQNGPEFAARSGHFFLKERCHEMTTHLREDLFTISSASLLNSNQANRTVAFIQDISSCRLSRDLIVDTLTKLIDHALFYEDFPLYRGMFQNLWSYTPLRESLISGLFQFYWKQTHQGIRAAQNTLRTIERLINEEGVGAGNIEEFNKIKRYQAYQGQMSNFFSSQLSHASLTRLFPKDFSDDHFGERLESSLDHAFEVVEQIQNASKEILNIGHIEMIVTPFQYMERAYRELYQFISHYHPLNIPQELKESFFDEMTNLANFLGNESFDVKKSGEKLMSTNKILSADTFRYLVHSELNHLNNISFNSTLYLNKIDNLSPFQSVAERALASQRREE